MRTPLLDLRWRRALRALARLHAPKRARRPWPRPPTFVDRPPRETP